MYDRAYLIILKLGGVPRCVRGYCANRKSVDFHAFQMCRSHVANVPESEAEVVAVYGVRSAQVEAEPGTDQLTERQVEEIVAETKYRQEVAAMPSTEDVDPKFPNRVLYERMFGHCDASP